MSERQSFILITDLVRSNALDAVRSAPDGWQVKVAPPLRTDAQSEKMWAMIGDVARHKPEGRQWEKDTWKAAFMHYLGHQIQFAEGLDNTGPFPTGFRSSRLTVRQMIDLIDCIYAYGNEHGVEWKETRKSGFFAESEAA